MLVSLSYLLAVAKHRNITKAAEELYISQPALSASIKRLEKKLNVSLLERGNNGITLTKEGECVLEYAKELCLLYERMMNDLKAMNKPDTGSLKVGSGMSHSADVIDEFIFQNPDQQITLIQYNNYNDMSKALLSHEIDLCISAPPVEGAGIITKTLCVERLCVAFGSGHEFAGKDEVSLQEIADSKRILALPAGFSLRIVTDKVFEDAKIRPQYSIQAETNAIAGLLHTSRTTGYSAIYPVSRCRSLSLASDNIIYRPIKEKSTRTIAASWLDKNDGNSRIELMLDFLTGYYSNTRYQL